MTSNTVYASPYANNIKNMENSEITGLAKNRFTDEETMLAISKYRRRPQRNSGIIEATSSRQR